MRFARLSSTYGISVLAQDVALIEQRHQSEVDRVLSEVLYGQQTVPQDKPGEGDDLGLPLKWWNVDLSSSATKVDLCNHFLHEGLRDGCVNNLRASRPDRNVVARPPEVGRLKGKVQDLPDRTSRLVVLIVLKGGPQMQAVRRVRRQSSWRLAHHMV